jgi:hypothetical protein
MQKHLTLPLALGACVVVEMPIRIITQHNEANVNVRLAVQDTVVLLMQADPSLHAYGHVCVWSRPPWQAEPESRGTLA